MYKKVLNGNTTYYVGKQYEQENIGQTVLQKNYIYVGEELVAVHVEEDDGILILPQNRYMHKDALGSIDTITNESGVVIQRLAYDAFGKQLVQEWINDTDKNKPLVKRGYTGHEHIEEFELIHMNGRVYDPTVGRFISADPNIFHPFDTQNFNRYSYVMNNPLKYTDPSGFDALADGENASDGESEAQDYAGEHYGSDGWDWAGKNETNEEKDARIAQEKADRAAKEARDKANQEVAKRNGQLKTQKAERPGIGFFNSIVDFFGRVLDVALKDKAVKSATKAAFGIYGQLFNALDIVEAKTLHDKARATTGIVGGFFGGLIGAVIGTVDTPGLGTVLGGIAGSTIGKEVAERGFDNLSDSIGKNP